MSTGIYKAAVCGIIVCYQCIRIEDELQAILIVGLVMQQNRITYSTLVLFVNSTGILIHTHFDYLRTDRPHTPTK